MIHPNLGFRDMFTEIHHTDGLTSNHEMSVAYTYQKRIVINVFLQILKCNKFIKKGFRSYEAGYIPTVSDTLYSK